MRRKDDAEDCYTETKTPANFDEPEPQELTVRVRGSGRRDDELEQNMQDMQDTEE